MPGRWHKESKQFLSELDPRIVAQDAEAAAAKQAERDAWATRVVALCRASEEYVRQREQEALERDLRRMG